ncbi:hypothetical protein CaCOL14_012700 [Colletotrichum acutatum]
MANTPTTSPIRVQTRQEQLTLRAVAQKIPIPTQPEPDSTDSTGHSDNEDGSEASSGSRAENDAEPSDNPPQTSVADKVNDQMRKYASGIPKELSGAKNAKLRNQIIEPVPDPEEPPLCNEQQEAMNLAMAEHNLFITGSGGCGKSVLVKALQTNFEAKHKKVHLIAPTGLAALNINGRTAFNYAGWMPDDNKKTFDAIIAKSRGEIFDRFRSTDVLIIDEISMVENRFFQRRSDIMRHVRGLRRKPGKKSTPEEDKVGWIDFGPFGGVQIIVVGDFCQLPPVKPFEHCLHNGCVKKTKEERTDTAASHVCPIQGHPTFQANEKWAFKSTAWEEWKFKYVHLRRIHRQKDEEFVGILQKCRLGKALDADDIGTLLQHPTEVENGARLYSLREEVDERNTSSLEELPGNSKDYKCHDVYRPSKYDVNDIDLGAKLVNGSQGVIVDFVQRDSLEMPTKPKKQNYEKDPEGYRRATERYRQMRHFIDDSTDPLPLVRFSDGTTRVIGPDCTVNETGGKGPKFYAMFSRTQIPLAPGWAMTIHKSQGMSLDRLIVNLGSVFEKGQAYVALSRARSLEGLEIEGTTGDELRDSLRVDLEVKRFLERLEGTGKETNPEPRNAGT